MAINAATLEVVVRYDDDQLDKGLKRSEGRVSAASVAIGTAIGNIAGQYLSQLPGQVFNAMTTIEDALMPMGTLLGTQSAEFAELSEQVKAVMANSPRSAEEIGAGAYALLSAGVSGTDNVMKALNASLQLADAGLGTTAEATDIITSAMNSFTAENLDAQTAAELMYGTIAKGKTTVSELAQGFGGIAPLAASAGVSFNDLMASVATLTTTGQKTSEVYSSMKAVLSNVIKPSGEAAEMAKKLGLEFNQAHLEAVGLPAFLDEIKVATGGNIETMGKLFGSTEALNSVIALTGDLAPTFAANLTDVAAAGDNMADRASEANETLSARLGILKNKVLVYLADIGTKGLDWLTAKWQAWGPTITKVINEVVGGFRAFVAAFKAGDGDVTSNGFAGMMERIANVARQVVDFVVANWPKVSEVIGQVAAYISTEVVPYIVDGLTLAREVFASVAQVVAEHWPQISGIISSVVEIVKGALMILVEFTQTQIEIYKEIWSRYGEQIIGVVSWAFDIILGVIGGALEIIKGIINTVLSVIRGDWSGAWDGIKQVASGAWDGIKAIVTGALDAIKAIGKEAFDLVQEYAGKAWDGIVSGVSGLGGRIASAASGIWDSIWNGFRSIINKIIGGWNSLSFSVPSIDLGPLGGKVGGFSVGVPDLPYLAQGGRTLFGGMAIVGERGPEAVWLPQGATVAPLPAGYSGAPGGGPSTVIVNMPAGSNGDDVVRALKQYERRNGRVPIRTN